MGVLRKHDQIEPIYLPQSVVTSCIILRRRRVTSLFYTFVSQQRLKLITRRITRYWSNSSRTDLSRRWNITFRIHKIINSTWNKGELPDRLRESIILPIHKKGDKTVIIIGALSLFSTFFFTFPIQNDLEQGDALSLLLSTLLWNTPLGRSKKTRWGWSWMGQIS
jgi:hypothetical protein